MSELSYDPAGVFAASGPLQRQQLEQLAPRLEQARKEVVELDLAAEEGQQTLDAHFLDMPQSILEGNQELGYDGVLASIQQTASRLKDQVNSVVLVGVGGSSLGLRAIMEACCGPYFNERGDSPRFYFAGESVDNDATRSLLDLLEARAEPFGIIVVSKSGATLEPAVAMRQLLGLLERIAAPGWPPINELVIPVTTAGSRLDKIADQLECRQRFFLPDRVGGRFSLLSPGGLLPAAVLGVDIVALLEGAVAMNERLVASAVGDNPALDYAGVGFLAETEAQLTVRVLASWDSALAASGNWYDQLLAESLGKDQRGATPIATLNTRDLHSRGQQHQQGRRDKLITNLVVSEPLTEPIPVGPAGCNHDQLDELAERTLPELLKAAREGTDEALLADGYPTTTLQLPAREVHWMGQFYQMMMIATVVEGKLLGVNPYGQPGVEAYKRNMARRLGLA